MSASGPSEHRVVKAVLRFDDLLGDEAAMESKVKVKAVFATSEEARAEVDRLNGLPAAADGGVSYRVQSSRFYDSGF